MERARPLLLAACLTLVAGRGAAQEPAVAPLPAEPSATSDARPGLWRLGSLYLTPTFHVGNVGIDTNVLFQAEDRKRDVSVSGGPGLDLVLPATSSLQLWASGLVDYLYFAETPEQRRLTGTGRAGIRYDSGVFLAAAEHSYQSSFNRPSTQVDDRVDQVVQHSRVDLGVGGSARRLGVSLAGNLTRYDIEGGQVYLGADLRANLARDEYLAQAALRYRLTPKTSLVLLGDYQWDRFLEKPLRDADSNRAMGGFEVVSETRLQGRALGGVRSFRPRAFDATRLFAVADVQLAYNVSPKTRFEARFQRDLNYSAFVTSGPTPTAATESYGLGLMKVLVARLDLRVSGSLNRLAYDGDVLLDLPDQGPLLAPRDDEYWLASADLGYTFGERFRLGFAASYADRNSSISYFGVNGLVLGATIVYSGTPTVTVRP